MLGKIIASKQVYFSNDKSQKNTRDRSHQQAFQLICRIVQRNITWHNSRANKSAPGHARHVYTIHTVRSYVRGRSASTDEHSSISRVESKSITPTRKDIALAPRTFFPLLSSGEPVAVRATPMIVVARVDAPSRVDGRAALLD